MYKHLNNKQIHIIIKDRYFYNKFFKGNIPSISSNSN